MRGWITLEVGDDGIPGDNGMSSYPLDRPSPFGREPVIDGKYQWWQQRLIDQYQAEIWRGENI